MTLIDHGTAKSLLNLMNMRVMDMRTVSISQGWRKTRVALDGDGLVMERYGPDRKGTLGKVEYFVRRQS